MTDEATKHRNFENLTDVVVQSNKVDDLHMEYHHPEKNRPIKKLHNPIFPYSFSRTSQINVSDEKPGSNGVGARLKKDYTETQLMPSLNLQNSFYSQFYDALITKHFAGVKEKDASAEDGVKLEPTRRGMGYLLEQITDIS